ncbi:FAD-linked oxidoreductase [Solimonas fluminis]|uniref:FAD-linked oxidoreductase n=1 Tax=Solimonas fluminis TaxID=2086571 RepID=A0A2S5TBF7_9GAMM|nr:D-arabinono-1,4-lactone oxidase [Solimonas fluminis]PPE72320.1 FAD-linked oxidoreductase [Solimonas fluminis]
MSLSRRELIKGLALVGAAGAMGLPGLAAAARRNRTIVWRNWSGAQSCIPAARLGPASEAALAELLRASRDVVRPVGAGHSFSALVPTDGTLVSLARLSGMIGQDAAKQQSEWWGGTPMSQMGAPLKAAGLALTNMADIDYQSLAGAIATATHGTGVGFGSYSTQVAGLRLVTASGEMLDCDARNRPEVFNAARVSLGALGFVTRVKLQNRPAFRLREKMWIQKTEEILEGIDEHRRGNRHWEMHVLTHSDYAAAVSLNETTDAPSPPPADPEAEGGNEYIKWIARLDKYGSDWPAARRALLNLVASTAGFEERVGESYEVFANVRNVRFNEMEYSVPSEAGPACLREILALIDKKRLPTWFPIEYRYIQGDELPISMFEGGERCAISIHQHYTMDYHNYFAEIEPIFWKHGGRPHWGKLHSLNARQLQKLYPRWKEFTEVRQALDPQGRFLNAHLRSILGVA